jgi:hypothetical protein
MQLGERIYIESLIEDSNQMQFQPTNRLPLGNIT